MTLRLIDPADAPRLAAFACSTGAVFEDEVERWIREQASPWASHAASALFQRRHLATLEGEDGAPAAVVAWQDIVQVDVEGIWVQVVAVAIASRGSGLGGRALDLALAEAELAGPRGPWVAGVVHRENIRSQQLVASRGWEVRAPWGTEHDLWLGRLGS